MAKEKKTTFPGLSANEKKLIEAVTKGMLADYLIF